MRRILATFLILSFALTLLPGILVSGLPIKAKASNGSGNGSGNGNGNNGDSTTVIVSTYGNATKGLKGDVARLGGKVRREFKLVNGFSVTMPSTNSAAIMNLLSSNPLVKSVSPNRNFITMALPPQDVNRKVVKADVVQN